MKTTDPTAPASAEEHFNINGDLEEAVERIIDGLTGTATQKQQKLHARLLALGKRFDITFADAHSLVMGKHPELRQDEDLRVTAYVPQLKTISQTKQAQREMDQKRAEQEKQEVASSVVMTRVAAILASDSSKSFGDAYNEVMTALPSLQNYGDITPPTVTTLKLNPPRPVAQPQMVMAKEDMPGVILVHGSDVGWTFPIWPQKS
jgi:hypothetical protein